MNWGGIRPALVDLVGSITGINDSDAIKWRGSAAAGGWRRGQRVTMSCRSIRGLGRDENRLSSGVTPGDEVAAVTCGNRKITWNLLFEGESADDADVAFEYADRFRTGIRRESSRDALRLIGLSVSEIEATQFLEFNSQGKPFSSAAIDVQLNAAENLSDDTTGASDYIAIAEYASDQLVDVAGELTEQIEETVP